MNNVWNFTEKTDTLNILYDTLQGGDMLQMNQIDQIKELQRQGLGSQEIADRLNIDRKTASKDMLEEDFNGPALSSLIPPLGFFFDGT
jgi:hypothetical protein